MKPEGKKRGSAAYYRLLYERSLLGGKVTCGCCGARLRVVVRNRQKRLGCPNRALHKCPMGVSVPYARAEEAVLKVLEQVLRSYPGWLAAAVDAMRRQLEQVASCVPQDLVKSQSQFQEVSAQLDRLVDAIADGGLEGPTVRKKVASLEGRKAELEARVRHLRQVHSSPMQMPDEQWIRGQLEHLAEMLKQEMASAAPHLRPMLASIVAEQVRPGTRTVGHARLRFTFDGWPMLAQILGAKLPALALSGLTPGESGTTAEFTVDLGRPSPIDHWAPKIAQWRAEKVTWQEIGHRTGIQPTTAHLLHKRWKEATASS